MERKLRYPSVSQKINGQSCLFQRHFQDSPACSYAVMHNIRGMSWRGKGALLPAPCLSKESSTVTPMPITIGAPAENRKANGASILILGSTMSTLSAPFRRVQLLLQSQNDIIKSGHLSHPYKGIINCLSRTIRNEGLFSLWRGHGAGFVALFTKRYYRLQATVSSAPKKDHKTAFLAEILQHTFAGCAIGLFVHPFFYAETRLANDVISITGQRQFSGGIDVCRKTLMTDGILGLYRGFLISQIAVVTHAIISLFVLPEIIPQSISYQSNFLPGVPMKAYFFGLFAAMAIYPMDTVSRRMIMSSGEGESAKYKNASDAFSQILKKEGVKSFYRGGGAEILRLIVCYGLATAMFYPVLVGVKRKETGNDDGGIPASNAIKLTWRNASVGSHDSEK